ncbi:MAG: helix-turn-helix transcriptional regulator [Pseudobdellovibrionaceae bacterium]|nr:helix-turn-helix transcriptional regulator [Pseudobdellovibrionaceae bacterium]
MQSQSKNPKLRSRELLTILKEILRARQISYLDISKKLGLSVAGVKKFMNADDCSVERLINLCDIAGISLFDLIKASHGDETYEELGLGVEQEQEILDDPIFLKFFWGLVIDRFNLSTLQTGLDITRPVLYSYLKRLDGWRMIKWEERDRIVHRPLKLLRFVTDGPLVRYLRKEYLPPLCMPSLKDTQRHCQIFRLSESSLHELNERLARLIQEFAHLALHEMRISDPEKLIPITLMTFVARSSPSGDMRVFRKQS